MAGMLPRVITFKTDGGKPLEIQPIDTNKKRWALENISSVSNMASFQVSIR